MHGLAVKVGTHGGGSVKGFQRIIIIIITVLTLGFGKAGNLPGKWSKLFNFQLFWTALETHVHGD